MDETTRLQHREGSMRSGNFWKERTILEKTLLIFVIVVIVVGIVLSISLASYKKEHCHTHPDSNDSNTCQTPECVASAAYLLSAMDTSVEPCEDFFSFACGGYLNKTPLLGKTYGRFTKLRTNIVLRMKGLLEEPLKDDDPDHWHKTKGFYIECMNLVEREKRAGTPLKEELDDLGKWPLLGGMWSASDFTWNDTLKKMFDKGYNKDILLKIAVTLDFKNSSETVVLIDQPALSMPRILYLLEKYQDALKVYVWFIYQCSSLLKGQLNENETMQQINDALEIEVKLANASLSDSERKNFELFINHMTTLDELEEKYPGINWRDLISSFLPAHVKLTGKERICAPVPTAIEAFESIVTNDDPKIKRKLANYMMYRAVLTAARDLSHDFLESFYDFYNVLTETPYSYPEPWQECVEITGANFFYSISSIYSKKYFKPSTKGHVSDVEKNIMQVLEDEIKDAGWIDVATENAALLKAEKIRAVIGYPEEILNDTVLNNFFEKLVVDKNHYENVREAFKFYADRDMTGLHEKYDKYRWDVTGNILVANAFYFLVRNAIVIPVGILQDETYNAERPNYLNYGSLGMLLGHEFTHGFDMTGSHFDENGDWVFWWTNKTYDELQKRSQCFIEQYNSYTIPGTNKTINGTLTLNDNMADTGGLRTAYRAYQRWTEKHGNETRLPGLPYTPNQLFWLSFASEWCTKETRQHLLISITYEVHAPPQYRVRGAVSNLEEFSKDFNCKKKAPMNPDKKCLLWT